MRDTSNDRIRQRRGWLGDCRVHRLGQDHSQKTSLFAQFRDATVPRCWASGRIQCMTRRDSFPFRPNVKGSCRFPWAFREFVGGNPAHGEPIKRTGTLHGSVPPSKSTWSSLPNWQGFTQIRLALLIEMSRMRAFSPKLATEVASRLNHVVPSPFRYVGSPAIWAWRASSPRSCYSYRQYLRTVGNGLSCFLCSSVSALVWASPSSHSR